jgi:hypothetical protein
MWSLQEIPPSLQDVINAAGGLQHVRFSGGVMTGNFCLWTGDAGCEDAEFLFELSWELSSLPISDLPSLCDLLGVERVRTFRVRVGSLGQYGFGQLWSVLEKLSAVEELELCTDAVREYCSARDAGRPLTVLPGLRSVRMVNKSTSDVAEITEEELLRVLVGESA